MHGCMPACMRARFVTYVVLLECLMRAFVQPQLQPAFLFYGSRAAIFLCQFAYLRLCLHCIQLLLRTAAPLYANHSVGSPCGS